MKHQTIKGKPALSVTSRDEWRHWLSQHHQDAQEIWLILYRKDSGKQIFTKHDALDDALCIGWIDSLVMKVDDTRYMQKFTPRRPDSVWSQINKTRVEKLIASGQMLPSGKDLVEHAKASGEWALNRSRPDPPSLSTDLESALDEHPQARARWEQLPPSHRKQYMSYITEAKLESTRQRRIGKCLDMLDADIPPSTL